MHVGDDVPQDSWNYEAKSHVNMIISDDFGRSQGQKSERDVRVYIARYAYNPYDGPNPCPEVELYLHAGNIRLIQN